MAFVILQQCDDRWVTERSVLLLHQASTQAEGTPGEIASSLAMIEALTDAMLSICADRMDTDVEYLRSKIIDRDWTFAGSKAVEYRAADGVVAPRDVPLVEVMPAPKEPSILDLLGL
jgi:ATP-dependent protease ClpP protease subunit